MPNRVHLLAVILAVGVFAGCGGDDPEPAAQAKGVDKAFAAKLDAVCDEAQAASDKAPPFPFDDFDPGDPDAKQLKRVGKYFERNAFINRDLRAGLEGLGEPKRGQEQWAALRENLIAQQDIGDEQVRAALAGDRKAFVRTYEQLQDLGNELQSSGQLRDIGLPDDSSCFKLF